MAAHFHFISKCEFRCLEIPCRTKNVKWTFTHWHTTDCFLFPISYTVLEGPSKQEDHGEVMGWRAFMGRGWPRLVVRGRKTGPFCVQRRINPTTPRIGEMWHFTAACCCILMTCLRRNNEHNYELKNSWNSITWLTWQSRITSPWRLISASFNSSRYCCCCFLGDFLVSETDAADSYCKSTLKVLPEETNKKTPVKVEVFLWGRKRAAWV